MTLLQEYKSWFQVGAMIGVRYPNGEEHLWEVREVRRDYVGFEHYGGIVWNPWPKAKQLSKKGNRIVATYYPFGDEGLEYPYEYWRA